MKYDADSVDSYMAQIPAGRRSALEEVRSIIRETAPEARETLAYNMPTYELGSGVLCSFASQKQYMSLYLEVESMEAHREELAHLNTGKSCIRFRRLEQLPVDTVKVMLQESVERLSGSSESD